MLRLAFVQGTPADVIRYELQGSSFRGAVLSNGLVGLELNIMRDSKRKTTGSEETRKGR